MSDPETPQERAAPSDQEPTSAAPPPVQETSSGGESSNRSLMIVLSYLWLLFLVPLLVDKDDKEVQWHAKNGFVLTLAEFAVHFSLYVISLIGVGCVSCIVIPFLVLGFAVVRLICIVKGINGERFMVPAISQYADKF